MAINIEVNADYKITSDTYNVIVHRKHLVDPTKSPNWAKLKENGHDGSIREDWREASFHRTLEKALNWIAEQSQRDSNAESIGELIRDLQRINGEIKAVLAR